MILNSYILIKEADNHEPDLSTRKMKVQAVGSGTSVIAVITLREVVKLMDKRYQFYTVQEANPTTGSLNLTPVERRPAKPITDNDKAVIQTLPNSLLDDNVSRLPRVTYPAHEQRLNFDSLVNGSNVTISNNFWREIRPNGTGRKSSAIQSQVFYVASAIIVSTRASLIVSSNICVTGNNARRMSISDASRLRKSFINSIIVECNLASVIRLFDICLSLKNGIVIYQQAIRNRNRAKNKSHVLTAGIFHCFTIFMNLLHSTRRNLLFLLPDCTLFPEDATAAARSLAVIRLELFSDSF